MQDHDCKLDRDHGCDCVKSQVEINKKAIKETEETYEGKTIREIFDNNSSEVMHYMRTVKGLACSECRGPVSTGNMYYYDFGAYVKCYDCQHNNK